MFVFTVNIKIKGGTKGFVEGGEGVRREGRRRRRRREIK